jgi:hypothetical protein
MNGGAVTKKLCTEYLGCGHELWYAEHREMHVLVNANET